MQEDNKHLKPLMVQEEVLATSVVKAAALMLEVVQVVLVSANSTVMPTLVMRMVMVLDKVQIYHQKLNAKDTP